MPLLLLHGAIGSSAQLKPLAEELRKSGLQPGLFDFAGHGGKEMPAAPFSIALFADEVVTWMNERGIASIDIFGYSMGGYVALYMAKHFPDRVGKIITVATKLAWNAPTAGKEVKMLDPGKIAEKVPKFAMALEQRHAPQDWKENLRRTGAMMLEMGNDPPLKEEDFRSIGHHVLMCVGDGDTMVSQDETREVQALIPNAGLRILGNTPHPVEQMNVNMLTEIATQFFAE